MENVRRRFGQFLKFLITVFLGLFALVPTKLRADGEDNPTGVAGIYNGNVTDGGNWDLYTGNVMRVVDDIVVPGSVGTSCCTTVGATATMLRTVCVTRSMPAPGMRRISIMTD